MLEYVKDQDIRQMGVCVCVRVYMCTCVFVAKMELKMQEDSTAVT